MASALNVDYLIDGTIRWSRNEQGAERVRMTPELIRVSEEMVLWSKTHNGLLEYSLLNTCSRMDMVKKRARLGAFGLVTIILVASAQTACVQPFATWFELWPVAAAEGGLSTRTEFDHPFVARGDHVLMMDVFRPADVVQPTPAVVLVHGGFWVFGERWYMHDWAADLAEQGYTVASIEYRLLGEGGQYPAPVADVLAAIAHLREHAVEWNVDPQCIAFFGVSAGAHLVLLAGMADDTSIFDPSLPAGESANVRAIVEFCGPTDFTADPESAQQWQINLLTDFLGGGLTEPSDRLREASPITHARADGPPVFILHGTLDSIVPVTQARSLRSALEEVGQPHRFFEVPDAGHFWGSVWASPPAQEHRQDILQFLEDNLLASPTGQSQKRRTSNSTRVGH